MKKRNILIGIIAVGLLIPSVAGWSASSNTDGVESGQSLDSDDTITVHRYMPGEIRDTVQIRAQYESRMYRQSLNAKINVLSRSYGDSIVLRWAPDDYVSWTYLNRYGVNIVRTDMKTLMTDTLAMALKPAALEEFRSRYSETDSLAGMAMGTLYGNIESVKKDYEAESEENVEMGSLYDLYQDQQMTFGVAVFVSELRPDLADMMAMRFVDKSVGKKDEYRYSIVPAVPDTTGHIPINAGSTGRITNERYSAEPFNVAIGDSITPPNGIRIWWERRDYSSYEIERRGPVTTGSEKWERLTERPYIIMMSEQEDRDCFYGDNVELPGTYEYRILAHDPFGDLTEPSPVLSVTINDMVPPRGPQITYIEIDRPNEDDPSAEIWANIHVLKDTIEDDFIGMIPMYYNARITGDEWRPLIDADKMMLPGDTVCRVDVTNIPTGQISVAAVDTAHNVGYSIPQLLRVSDMRPPKAPQGLTASTEIIMPEEGDTITEPLGLITLTWNAIDDDDVEYYDVVFANDTTHTFLVLQNGMIHDTTYVDTVALDVNQKYIYYKVRAVDYSSNIGGFSDLLQVIRPSLVPPTTAHLDSSYVDGKGIYMCWVAGDDEQIAYHNIYRRLMDSDEWTLIRHCDADSVKAEGDVIRILDVPKVNREEMYVYAVESFNYSGISSGLSLQYCVRFEGEAVFSLPLRLFAAYDEKNNETKLAWEVDNAPEGNDWYFCIWRQGADDDVPKFLMSADAGERGFTDYLLGEGEEARYVIFIQMEDGRESEPSNVVTVKAPVRQ